MDASPPTHSHSSILLESHDPLPLNQSSPPSDADADANTDSDALFDALEAEDDKDFRAARLKQLSAELSAMKATTHPASSGQGYRTLKNDEEVLDFTTKSDKCVVHFSHPDFGRCAVMDAHLKELDVQHGEAEWAKVDVRDCVFVVEKLGVRVLPCVIGFVDGQVKGRVTGFEGLMVGGNEEGQGVTKQLEKVLLGFGVLHRGEMDEEEGEDDEEPNSRTGLERRSIRGRMETAHDDDEDDDWD